ncbi:MAG: alpha,6-mannosyltransferase [Nocardioidaceae bacterium]|nr:alpha,6-mannosyltransferase [Nocardioidaceae bacterium]
MVGTSILTCVGALAGRLAVTPYLAGWMLIRTSGKVPGDTALATAISMFGLLLLTWAWLQVGRRAHYASDHDLLRTIRRAIFAWSAPLLIAPPLFSGDGWSYAATGLMVGRGLSPYETGPVALGGPIVAAVSARWRDTPSPYGPLPLWLGGQVAQLTEDPWVQLYAFRGMALTALGLLVWALPRLARRAGTDPGRALWLGAGSPLVLAHGIGGVHLDLLMAALVAVALLIATSRKWVLAAVIVGLAASVKSPALAAVVGVTLLSLSDASLVARARRASGVALVALTTVVLVGGVTGLGVGWIGGASAPLSTGTSLTPSYELGRLLTLLSGVPLEGLTKDAGVLALVCLATLILLRAPVADADTANARHAALRWGVVVLVLALGLSPLVHYWYAFWCLPLLACLHLSPRAAATTWNVSLVLGVIAPLDASLHIPGLTSVAVGAIVASLVLGLYGRRIGEWARDSRTGSGPAPDLARGARHQA